MPEKIITFIESLVAIFVAIPTVFAIINEEKIYAILFGIFLFIFLCIIVCFHIIRKNKSHDNLFYRKVLYHLSVKGKYTFNTKELYYEYADRIHINHSKKFEVLARVDGVDYITDRYVFSGSNQCELTAPIQGQFITDQFKDHGWDFYSIKAPTPLAKNDKYIFEMKMNTIFDPNKKAKSFLSTGIYEPTKKLKIEVSFKDNLIPQNVKLLVFRDYVDRMPIITRELKYDSDKGAIIYELDYPIHYYKYMISWDFAS